jgi:amino acid transporter
LVILITFIADGLFSIFTRESLKNQSIGYQFTPFFSNGLGGLFTTIGFVFVSYLGLTQVASVAEEIKNPEKNIPLVGL